jgi:orotate phosphoribosyltransferase
MRDELLRLLAGRRGHFQTESGYHSEWWFDLASLLADRERLRPFVAELARRLAPHRLDAVCGPMTGGAQLAAMIGAELGLAGFATERIAPTDTTGLFPVKYVVPAADRTRIRSQRIAIVDDAISAGSAVRGTHTDLLACGATPVVCGALFVFGEAAAKFAASHGLKLEVIAEMKFDLWNPAECPHCRTGVALDRVSDAV